MTSRSPSSTCVVPSQSSSASSVTETSHDHQLRGGGCPTERSSDTSPIGVPPIPTKDLNSLQFFYNLGIDYFRQCIKHPPPNILSQSQQCQPSYSSTGLRHSVSSSPTPNKSHFHLNSDDVAKSNRQSPDAPSASPDACQLLSFGPVQSRHGGTGTRTVPDPLDVDEDQQESEVPRAVDDSRENNRVDAVVAPKLIYRPGQKVIDTPEELGLSRLGERGYRSPSELVGSDDADMVYHCSWMTRESCEDSGCMSDLSSDSPPATASRPHSLMNDSSVNDQASEDDYTLTQNISDLDLDRSDDDKQRDVSGGCVERPMAISIPVQSGVGAPSVPRYIRPMREIPPRFRRLLAAEAERVVRLCQRLNGSPLYSAATPSDGAPTNVDGRTTLSDVGRNSDAVYVDKPLAGQTSYTSQSPLIYVTAQSSSMPLYPPAPGISVPLTSYSHASGVEPTSFVLPVGVPDASLQGCSNVPCPPAQEALPPSVPMLYANPVYYYPSATLPPPDVASAFSYVVPSPVVSGCPQPGTVETGSLQSGYARNNHSDQVNVAADTAAVGIYQSALNEGCASYCYQPPCHELSPYCSLQMMQA